MSKTIPTALLTALTGKQVQPYYAVEMIFDTSPLYLWSGIGDRVIGSNTYIGAGNLITVSGIKEVNDMSAQGITLTLSGVSSSIVSLALEEPYQGRVCNVYFGEETVTDVTQIFSGFMDKMTISDGPDSATIALSVESKMVDLNRARVFRYTDESQKSRYPNDTFFSFVAGLQTAPVVWGKGQ